CALFVGMYAWISLVTGDWQLIMNQFVRRSAELKHDAGKQFDWIGWITEALYGLNVQSHSKPLLGLTVGWLIPYGLNRRRGSAAMTLTRIRRLFGAIHVIIGKQGVLVHDWWWWPLTPGVCLAAGLMLDAVARWLESPNPAPR